MRNKSPHKKNDLPFWSLRQSVGFIGRAISIMFFVLFFNAPFFGKACFFLVIMLLHMLLFGGYAFGYALFFGVTYDMPQKGDYAPAYIC